MSQWRLQNLIESSNASPLMLAAILVAIAGTSAEMSRVIAEEPARRIMDASEQGTFNVGTGHAVVSRVPDQEVGGDVLKVDFSLPPGTAAGVYARTFPEGIDADHVEVVNLATRLEVRNPSPPMVLALEIKGATGVQRVPLDIRPGFSRKEARLDWRTIGVLKEVVISASHVGGEGIARATILVDARFEKASLLRSLSSMPLVKLDAILLLGLLVAGLITLMRRARAWIGEGVSHFSAFDDQPRGVPGPSWLRDLATGAGLVLTGILALAIFHVGGLDPEDAGRSILGLALSGAVIGSWWRRSQTGSHSTPTEGLLDTIVTGLLALTASPIAMLQPPSSWSQIFRLSQTVAGGTALVYHIANARRLASSARHLSPAVSALIVSTPFVFGGLTLLESEGLLQGLGGWASFGTLYLWPQAADFLARVLVIYLFNIAVARGLSMVTPGPPMRSPVAHAAILGVAVAVVAAPLIASFGSGDALAGWPVLLRRGASVVSTILSQGPLWAEAYLLTGMALDAIHGRAPSRESVIDHPVRGMKKGVVYSGTYMGILQLMAALGDAPPIWRLATELPRSSGMVVGALAFPLIKTIIETFDGSQAFFRRVRASYGNSLLYARGALIGLGFSHALTTGIANWPMGNRVLYGATIGALTYAGIDLVRDLLARPRGHGRIQSARYYLIHAILGAFIGAALGFYFDSNQLSVVRAKFRRYVAIGAAPEAYDIYPLVSKWGHLRLGMVSGGASLLFMEALAGLISWSTAAWMFAINRTFMTAYFEKQSGPIRSLFTRGGMIQLAENMIFVLRWGLWMSPVINSFLRPMGVPTWYNQDGAIRTVMATFQDMTLTPDAFRAWSLHVFTLLLAYDGIRILIWLDHMGLRVATFVNLSFLGVDRLERTMSRLLAPAATARCIPEGIKRFTTWGPLLIPFYIPRGVDWDSAWSTAEAIQGRQPGGPVAALINLAPSQQALITVGAVVATTAVYAGFRRLGDRLATRSPQILTLENGRYEVSLGADGAIIGRAPRRDIDLSRRSYDLLDPAGRALFLIDPVATVGQVGRFWPLIGNLSDGRDVRRRIAKDGRRLLIEQVALRLRIRLEISLAAGEDEAEIWTITVENPSDTTRSVKLVPYLEWVLNHPDADRGHTQYNRLFGEMEYAPSLHAVLARDKHAKVMALMATDRPPDGFLTSRMDFIGRARRLANPRVLESLAFSPAVQTPPHATLDPIGSLSIPLNITARASAEARVLIGFARDRDHAGELVGQFLGIPVDRSLRAAQASFEPHPIGHGEIPTDTPLPYSEFHEDGRRLLVRSPFTPRPFDHTMSNGIGQVTVVTNRGLHTSSNVNSQQNRLTPDWSDIVTRELPGEAIYLYDPDRREWFSPTYHPLNDREAELTTEFGVDGTATFHMAKGSLATELTVFVPPDEPTSVYMLTIRNRGEGLRRLRMAAYFQIVLASQPEFAGALRIRTSTDRAAILFENPRNTYRTGPAFVAIAGAPEKSDVTETRRGRFFGQGRDVAHPILAERGEPDAGDMRDDRPIAGVSRMLEIPPGAERTVSIVLGQAGSVDKASNILHSHRDPEHATGALERTRAWWTGLMDTLRVKTTDNRFDHYLDWLKYQSLAERIWARRGFYQASGAFGFRDQLQDAINLIWVDPVIARNQILLHAAQQFVEGDVVHWFHLLQDGRTGFVGRTHASDNLLWLAWASVEYVNATGDHSILDECVPYLESEQPFEPLPFGKGGIGFDPLRSPYEVTLYRHCLRAIDLVLERKMGIHGLPLMGTGDWNDGLDEIGGEGRGESVWLGLFLHYILSRMTTIVGAREGGNRQAYYEKRNRELETAIESTWRGDRYLRAIHDDGTEIGVEGSGVWEIDALTAAWAVMTRIDLRRGAIVFETALRVLERDRTILLGWPPLREDTHPYLGRSSGYPEGVRENGMYCHGVQWLVGAARILADWCRKEGRIEDAGRFAATARRLWYKISAISHVEQGEIETYGGQPNKQAADLITTFDPGRMIWNGYTGAAGWMLRQAYEGVLGLKLFNGEMVPPIDPVEGAEPELICVVRDLTRSPLEAPPVLRTHAQEIHSDNLADPSKCLD